MQIKDVGLFSSTHQINEMAILEAAVFDSVLLWYSDHWYNFFLHCSDAISLIVLLCSSLLFLIFAFLLNKCG